MLVVFGDDVLIFSDKSIEWKDNDDLSVSWSRWYRRAVKKSVEQIRGADRWLKEHPDRIFIDKACQHPLPIDLPPANQMRSHGIAIAIGAEDAGRRFFGGDDGTFMIVPSVKGADHAPQDRSQCQPFFIGDVDPIGSFIHVFDRSGLDLVMKELDTISDLVRYLNLRADFIRSGSLIIAPSEADLLGWYLQNENFEGSHVFAHKDATRDTKYSIDLGHYRHLLRRPEYHAKINANRTSYVWDNLIGHFSQHVIDGTAIAPAGYDSSVHLSERGLRIMAGEDRTRRRLLAHSFLDASETASKTPEQRFVRAAIPAEADSGDHPAYVFLFLPYQSPGSALDDGEFYREVRRSVLETYIYSVLRKNRHVPRAVGIAMAPPGSVPAPFGYSEDLMALEVGEWDDETIAEIEERERVHSVMIENRLILSATSVQEYPQIHVSRQQRRAAERRAKKDARRRS